MAALFFYILLSVPFVHSLTCQNFVEDYCNECPVHSYQQAVFFFVWVCTDYYAAAGLTCPQLISIQGFDTVCQDGANSIVYQCEYSCICTAASADSGNFSKNRNENF